MRTIGEVVRGRLILRLFETKNGFSGAVIGGAGGRPTMIEGANREDVWRRLQQEAGKADRSYFGFDGARARFLRFFAEGFEMPDYAKVERNYKDAAKRKLDATAPLADAAVGSGFGEAVLSVFRATNLLAPIEKTRLQDVLRGPSADAFIRAAGGFARGPGPQALAAMARILRPHDCAKWTVVTYLPFLWRPDRHMFLKPEVTREFAARVGHAFAYDYEPRLHMPVYASLLDLAQRTQTELGELRPRDWIDVQSFIWVVGNYDEAEGPTRA